MVGLLSVLGSSRAWTLTVMTVLLSVGARPAEACECFANPPCAAIWKADAVFVGTVIDRVQERVGGSISWAVHNVAVTQRLHGAIDSYVSLVPGNRPSPEQIEASKSRSGELMTMSTCDYGFEPGKQYLIYARRTSDGRWTTSKCGTKPLEEASADLDYIASIPSAQPTGRVYGIVERTVLNPADRSAPLSVPAADVRIALVNGTSRLTATTDSEGKLDVQVPPGNYTIGPIVPETVRVYGAPSHASVPARGCAPVHFSLISNGRLEGHVMRSDGTPVSGATVDVVPADVPLGRPDSFTTSPPGTTDASGRFLVDAILPGRYVVSVNARFGPTLFAPYRTTYFPGVGRQDARVVEFSEGERKTGFTIVVDPLPETTVSGVVVFDDDRRVTKADVTAVLVDHRGVVMGAAKTDNSGSFELRLLAGVTYLVRAVVRTENGYRQTETVVVVDQRLDGLRLSLPR